MWGTVQSMVRQGFILGNSDREHILLYYLLVKYNVWSCTQINIHKTYF